MITTNISVSEYNARYMMYSYAELWQFVSSLQDDKGKGTDDGFDIEDEALEPDLFKKRV